MDRAHTGVWLLVATALAGCRQPETAPQMTPPGREAGDARVEVKVLSRRKALRYDPCSQCHQHIADGQGTVSSPHSSIRVQHMDGGACSVCHVEQAPDFLQLVSGKRVSIDAAHELCAQCHSQQTADWELGIHGKQVGNWRTLIHRYACGHCHDPHRPAFGTQIALPPPPFPALGIEKENH